ncbi:hypothetical protein QC763_122870 [Podospora pseudopauciseta]|uniref:Prp 4 CRoW domain-containing protein n=5 Tax=Podospora TaxID=5144 RepID=A0A090CGQ0_PODAN|nr:hypothetical protein QC763_122870 [Podospora pseudopauciseta]KAK4683177.1 hypothetical protein QC764_122870 [Podospora pseudoanserina]CDP24689.1 Putative protein of unknown function [Podospora anserina S mat+]VBB73931.1 Putative protein of unknown function [Podospora comata]
MLAKSITALAALAFAVNVAAEQPYKPQLVKMSTRSLFSIGRRQDAPGYQPEQAVCGEGNTCEEACGAGYTTCASTDNQVHCFNAQAAQTCCPDQSGNSCDAGYYCTADKAGETWCCPNSMDLEACAAAFEVTGGLVSQTPPPATSTSTTSSEVISTAPPTTTSTSASSSIVFGGKNSTSAAITITSSGLASASASATGGASNSTVSLGTSPSPSAPAPSVSNIAEGAAGTFAAPVSALLLIAGVVALL